MNARTAFTSERGLVFLNGEPFATTFGIGETARTTRAARIARHCNAHDDLVAALREIASKGHVGDFWVDIANAALAKVGAL